MIKRLLRAALAAIPLLVSACADDVVGLSGEGTDSRTGTGTTTLSSASSDPTTTDSSLDGVSSSGTDAVASTTSSATASATEGSSGPGTTAGGDDCCFENGSPGCSVPAIEMCVCALDPFCCRTEWDQICIDMAVGSCGADCEGGSSDSGSSSSSSSGSDSGSSSGSSGTTAGSSGSSTGDSSSSGGVNGDCCVVSAAPGCDDPTCEADICAIDESCCVLAWDSVCVANAEINCPEVCGAGSSGSSGGTMGTGTTDGESSSSSAGGSDGDCCIANGTPGCEDSVCEAAVCMLDPMCCDVLWDGICAGEASIECPELCGSGGSSSGTTTGGGMVTTGISAGSETGTTTGGTGDCCIDNETPGCDDPTCEAAVCALDAFCCDTEWDGSCADDAAMVCPVLCPGSASTGTTAGTGTTGGSSGDCCIDNGTPGCEDPVCEASVCGIDAFCCDVEWGEICADEAEILCPVLCGGAVTTGVGTTTGVTTIITGIGTGGGTGDCCADNMTPGCEDPTCELAVCTISNFCCESQWDGICAGIAETECTDLCGTATTGTGVVMTGGVITTGVGTTGGETGDCCADHAMPGCDDPTCEETVCMIDTFCCETTWDANCVAHAEVNCAGLCDGMTSTTGASPGVITTGVGTGGGTGDCCIDNMTPGCEDPGCEAAVCGLDPFCCDTEWDDTCAASAAMECAALCSGSSTTGLMDSGDCCIDNMTPGCEDPGCEAAVCAVDDFCCNSEWDQVCADEAVIQCPALCA